MKKQYFHPHCLEEKERQIEDRKELIQYICDVHKIDKPTGMILKQIKDFQEQYDYKLKGMTLALKYFYETLGNQVREGDGIGIIPFIYEDAKRHYILKKQVEESIENIESLKQVKIVEVNSPQFGYKRHLKKIDISML